MTAMMVSHLLSELARNNLRLSQFRYASIARALTAMYEHWLKLQLKQLNVFRRTLPVAQSLCDPSSQNNKVYRGYEAGDHPHSSKARPVAQNRPT